MTAAQTLPIVSINIRYLVIYGKLHDDTRVGDDLRVYVYPVPAAGAPTITLKQMILTNTILQHYITNKREHFEIEVAHRFSSKGIHDVYFDQTDAGGTNIIVSRNLQFIVQ